MVLIVVGFVELPAGVGPSRCCRKPRPRARVAWDCAPPPAPRSGTYSAGNTTSYVVSLASSRGVTITTAMVALNNTATCGGTGGFSMVTINDSFTTAAPALLTPLANGFAVQASACFPTVADTPRRWRYRGGIPPCSVIDGLQELPQSRQQHIGRTAQHLLMHFGLTAHPRSPAFGLFLQAGGQRRPFA